MKEDATFQVMKSGKQIVIRMFVISAVKPTAAFIFGGKTITIGGRYSMDMKQQDNGYSIMLTVNQVNFRKQIYVAYV